MQTILITGGTGLIGKALGQKLIEKGYQVIILTRKLPQQSTSANISYALWDVEKQTIDKSAIAKSDAIIHLAGAGVADKRWSEKRKQEIIDSRVNSCKLILDSLKSNPNKVKVVVSASAIGWYGEDPVIPNPKPFEEDDSADKEFLGHTCMLWEQSIQPVTHLQKRLVIMRTGIVLSKEGGALKEFIKPMQLGVAGILGNGKQIVSWIHIDDLVSMYMSALEKENLTGIYNAVAPQPVSNKELTIAIAKARQNFYIPMPVPSFVLKIVMGEMSIEVLKSATVSAKKIESQGFHFLYPNIKIAVADLVKNN